MSLSLTLVFDQYKLSGPLLAFNRLRLEHQDYALFERMKAEATPLPEGLQWYGDEGIEECADDPYGKKLTFLTAYAVARHLSGVNLQGWTAAVLAFLNALPADTRVVLWWD